MTTPQVSLVDAGNGLLSQVPAQLHTGSLSGPSGKVGVLTIRTASTTMSVFLSTADLRTWVELLSGLADEMSGGLVQASVLDVAVLGRTAEQRGRQ